MDRFSTRTRDFALLTGGPVHRLFVRLGIASTAPERTLLRVALAIAVSWIPLCVLSLFEARETPAVLERFVRDVELHARFLVAFPLLLAGGRFADVRLNDALRQFQERKLIAEQDRERFDSMIGVTERLRDALWPEAIIVLVVFTVGRSLYAEQVVEKANQWYADGSVGGRPFAAIWYGSVAMTLFQFVLFRWYFRTLLWFALLWRIAGLRLQLVPTHPDRAGGTAFLGHSLFAFGPLIVAHTALLSGMLANRALDGEALTAFRPQVAGLVGSLLAVMLLPLLRFSPQIRICRRRGLLEYGEVAMRCVRDFDRKWGRHGTVRATESVVESSDVQSVADMANSFEVVRGMGLTPFDKYTVLGLLALILLPLLPLVLTLFSAQELLSVLLKVIF